MPCIAEVGGQVKVSKWCLWTIWLPNITYHVRRNSGTKPTSALTAPAGGIRAELIFSPLVSATLPLNTPLLPHPLAYTLQREITPKLSILVTVSPL